MSFSAAATPRLIVPNDTRCACVGKELTYTCTAVGGGSTLWTGTAFDCSNNWINLRHSLFSDPNRGATGDCSGGALVGQSIGVTGNCYTSQLHVRVAADMNNETINCDHRPGTEINTIGESTLIVMTGKYYTLSITKSIIYSWHYLYMNLVRRPVVYQLEQKAHVLGAVSIVSTVQTYMLMTLMGLN